LGGGHGGVINGRWSWKECGGDVGARESIGDDILLARNMANVSREFGDVGQLALLACRPGRRFAVHGGGEWLVVSMELKRTAF
jgi:hypothetical protein